jgi:hypothetical protein
LAAISSLSYFNAKADLQDAIKRSRGKRRQQLNNVLAILEKRNDYRNKVENLLSMFELEDLKELEFLLRAAYPNGGTPGPIIAARSLLLTRMMEAKRN